MHRTRERANWRRRLKRLLREQRGQSLVETAITLSILMMFVFVFIEVCLAFYSFGVISEEAREGSRYASVHGSTCVTASSISCTASASALNTYVSNLGYPNLAGGTMTVNTTFPDGSQAPGSRVKVAITYVLPIMLALVPSNALTLNASSTVTILQ
jgi:Flp pilus assembly protein TadG